MIFYDRVTVVGSGGSGQDWPAEVRPLGSSETVDPTSAQVSSRYRVFLPAEAESTVSSQGTITWRGKEHYIDGDVEPHAVMGRLHHLEVLVHRVTG